MTRTSVATSAWLGAGLLIATLSAQGAPRDGFPTPGPSALSSTAPGAIGSSAPPAPRTITMRFHEVALHEAIDILSRHWRVNILLGKGVTGKVTANLYDVSLEQALNAVAQATGYVVERRRGDYIVLDRQEQGQDASGANTTLQTYKVQYSNVKQVAEILGKYVSRQGKITMLPDRNLLVVEDSPDFQVRIERLLATIDAEPRQILIEAKILEITLDRSESYGVDWSRVFGNSSISTTGLASKGTAGLVFNLVNQNLQVFLSALASDGRVKTLSTPRLLALENQEAQTVVGERTGYKVTTTINQVTTESIQFLDTGVILKVTPSVDQRGRVLMNIHPEVSSASIAAGIPSKKSTEVTTQLLCEDGQSVFIGGLIKREGAGRKSGVPLLKDIPGIGAAFSRNESSALSTETVVVITPRIVKSPKEISDPIPDQSVVPLPISRSSMTHSAGLQRESPEPSPAIATDDVQSTDERAWFTWAASQLRRKQTVD